MSYVDLWQAVPIQSKCGKAAVVGCVGLVGVPSPSGSPPGLCWWGGTIPDKVALGMPDSPLDPPSHLGQIDFVHLLLAVMQMRMTHWQLPPLWVAIPSAHGGGWPLMRWMGSCGTSHTPGLAYNVPSNCALILAYLSAPRAVGHSIEMA